MEYIGAYRVEEGAVVAHLRFQELGFRGSRVIGNRVRGSGGLGIRI